MTFSPKLITWTRRTLLAVAVLVTVAALCIAEENWRGDRDWRRVQAEYAARHEPLRLEAFSGPRVPDDQNLFKAPVWLDLISDRSSEHDYQQARENAGLNQLVNVRAIWSASLNFDEVKRQMVDAGVLAKDDSRPSAEAVLAGLSRSGALLDGLRHAVKERPLAAALPDSLPHFSPLRVGSIWSVAKLLAYRARVELAVGQPDDAYEDTFTLLRIAHACELKPAYLLQSLVVVAMAGQVADILKVACATHAWSEPQLASLQAQFAALRPRDYLVTALKSERAWQLSILEAAPSMSAAERAKLLWPWWMIRGWVQQDKIALCEKRDDEVDALQAYGTAEYTRRVDRLQQEENDLKKSRAPYRIFTRLVSTKTSGMLRNVGVDLDELNAALTAFAVERYYVAHGRYPGSLAEVVPVYLGSIPPQSNASALQYTVAASGAGFELHETPRADGKPREWTPVAPVAGKS